MASSNRVFVSPGVYTSEKDLTFVAQSVGVTTLGLVGEALKGPAFEPILISNFDEFKTYFGPTSPVKDGLGNPKYELPYVAKSYLEESNQLFVTRVLGLTGYKPSKTYGIKTLGGVTVDLDTVSTTGMTMDPDTPSSSPIFGELSGKTAHNGSSITTYIQTNFSGFTNTDNGKWFVIGQCDSDDVAALTAVKEVISPLTGLDNETSNHEKEWYNTFFNSGATITDVYAYLFVYSGSSGVFNVTRYAYDAELNSDYHNVVVAALRPRGSYSGQTLLLEVTGSTVGISEVTGSDLDTNPLGEFTLNVTGSTSGAKSFTCSLDTTSTKYITKVLGTEVFDKVKSEFPLYVHESYPNLLKTAFDKGLIRGLSTSVEVETDGNNFLGQWDTTISPMVVSEVRGGEVADLFEVITISDGESANFQVKITIQNIDLDTGDFDLIVRDFNDTDDTLVVLEKFTRCNLNPDLPGYIAKKVGTSDGEYELRSRYIMLSMADNHPIDAFPAGFKGFKNNSVFGSTGKLGNVLYKTQYYSSGDVISYDVNGTPILSNGDKVRKVSLGLSSQVGIDRDLLKYKGLGATTETFGFHLSTNASTITGSTYQCTPYNLEGVDKGQLENINFRKFTFAVFGGFDGWDIYRNVRTNGDGFIFGRPTYVNGHTTNSGVFSSVSGNSDYYSYLAGINTFANPEAIDINVFATPGINFFDHSSLVTQAIEMIENDRADSLYIINSPNKTTAEEVIDDLDSVALDSNYSATYWPWIQVRDGDNATQLYLPPTGEVLKNIALTDNVSYPWFAVAGYSRGLVNAVKAYKKLTLDERDDLYKNRINPIATFSDTGTIIWGNKTLQVRESALDRINVRRLLLRARKLISAVAVRLLFEQNDEQVRNEFLRLVNPILESIKKERGLFDFRVTVSNDPEDIDANTLRGKIYVKPTRSLEFIDVEFIITPTGASFDNI
jgi:RNA recognition motif-containing protein